MAIFVDRDQYRQCHDERNNRQHMQPPSDSAGQARDHLAGAATRRGSIARRP